MMTSRSALGVAVAAVAVGVLLGLFLYHLPKLDPQYTTEIQRQFGSPFHPSAVGEAPAEFTLAELYQDLSADTRDGLYDSDGHLQVRWNPQPGGCALNLPLAEQHVRTEREPTPTPAPTATPHWVTVIEYVH